MQGFVELHRRVAMHATKQYAGIVAGRAGVVGAHVDGDRLPLRVDEIDSLSCHWRWANGRTASLFINRPISDRIDDRAR